MNTRCTSSSFDHCQLLAMDKQFSYEMDKPRLVLLLSILLLYVEAAHDATANLASRKHATQSDVYDDNENKYGAGQALDGNTMNGEFSHTKIGYNKWWMVDLGQPYEVTNVELYNRQEESFHLKKVYILTSNNTEPTSPDPSSEKWQVRYYHELPFGALGNIILEEGVPVQHVAVFSAHNEGVSLVEVAIYSYHNLAYKCHASQHIPLGEYSATKAVDGILYGEYHFSHTKSTDSWWRVDLGGKMSVALVELYSRTDDLFERFQKIDLWSLAETTSMTILNKWDTVSTYEGTATYNPVAVFNLNSSRIIRYLQVTTRQKENIITLKEVQVFRYPRRNYALHKPTEQVDTFSEDGPQKNFNSGFAVDGSTAGRFSHTEEGRGKWWKVDLGMNIIFQYARIYVRSGKGCRTNEIDETKLTECADRVSNTTYFTNHKDSDQPPKNNTDGWKACMRIKDPLGKKFTITCQDGRTPYTRQFAIVMGHKYGVALSEVEVYGYNQPLVKQEGAKVNHKSYGRVEITIPKWTKIKDEKPWIYNTLPTTSDRLRYTLSVDGHDPIAPSFEDGRVASFFWPTEKIAGRSGRFEISCLTDEGVCPGPITFGTFEKDPGCTALGPVEELTFKKLSRPAVSRNGKRIHNFTISWKAPAIDCDLINPSWSYIYKLNNDTEVYTKGTHVVVQVDAGTTSTFEVRAQNKDDPTSEATTVKIQSPPAAPSQPTDPKLKTSIKKGCVTLTWSSPQYSNGIVIGYQTKCTDQLKWSKPINSTSAEICGYSGYQLVNCTVRANTQAPDSGDETASNSARTLCEVSLSQRVAVLPADNKQPRSVVIKIFPVTLEDPDLVISSYIVLLTKHTSGESANNKWTKVAELSNDLVTAGGYIFYIGDEKAYGRYMNSLIEPGASCTVKLAITIHLSQESISTYQEMNEQTDLTAPLQYCEPPRDIEHSIHKADVSKRVGETVSYSCAHGYTKSEGEAELACFLSENYTLYWNGSDIVCTQDPGNEGIYIGTGAGGAALFVILAVVITIVVIKKRKMSADASDSAPDSNPDPDYMNLPKQKNLTYEDPFAAADDDHLYDNLGCASQYGKIKKESPC